MVTVKPSLAGLNAAFLPGDPEGAAELARQQWDEEEAQRRAERTYGPGDIGQQAYFNTFNDGQTDAATGAAGYNRQWVPLLQGLKGKRLGSAPGLPTEQFSDLDGSGHMVPVTNLAELSKRKVKF